MPKTPGEMTNEELKAQLLCWGCPCSSLTCYHTELVDEIFKRMEPSAPPASGEKHESYCLSWRGGFNRCNCKLSAPAPSPDSRPAFEEHTKAVGKFLNELYAIMVDPLAEGEIKVAEMCETLLNVAREQREQLYQQHYATPSQPDTGTLTLAAEMLEKMYDLYENGIDTYEDPEDQSGYCGKAFQLEEGDEDKIIAVLKKLFPRAATSTNREGKG